MDATSVEPVPNPLAEDTVTHAVMCAMAKLWELNSTFGAQLTLAAKDNPELIEEFSASIEAALVAVNRLVWSKHNRTLKQMIDCFKDAKTGHVFEKHNRCTAEPGTCIICDGGLSFCLVCREGESGLAPTCPGLPK